MNLSEMDTALTTEQQSLNAARDNLGTATAALGQLRTKEATQDDPTPGEPLDLDNPATWTVIDERFPNHSTRHREAVRTAHNALERAAATATAVLAETVPTRAPESFATQLGQRVFATVTAEVPALPLLDLATRFRDALAEGDDLVSYAMLLAVPSRLTGATSPDDRQARRSLETLVNEARRQFADARYLAAQKRAEELRELASKVRTVADRRKRATATYPWMYGADGKSRSMYVGKDWNAV